MSQTCLDCARAKWNVTNAGRLHPNGEGQCTWILDMPKVLDELWP